MKLRAIMTSVDYADLLLISLPYNRGHFIETWIVTTPDDIATQEVAYHYGCEVVLTELFYESGPNDFNKWRALEYGLDEMGRDGWICVMDADILWPKNAAHLPVLEPGYLLTPYRRMAPLLREVPPESEWLDYPRHQNVNEWAGYTQVFHASDPVLGKPPWYDTSWIHAGGADSFFQRKWDRKKKIRPTWEVLHLGDNAKNWFGRVSPFIDGSAPPLAPERLRRLREILAERTRRARKGESDPYGAEKYPSEGTP